MKPKTCLLVGPFLASIWLLSACGPGTVRLAQIYQTGKTYVLEVTEVRQQPDREGAPTTEKNITTSHRHALLGGEFCSEPVRFFEKNVRHQHQGKRDWDSRSEPNPKEEELAFIAMLVGGSLEVHVDAKCEDIQVKNVTLNEEAIGHLDIPEEEQEQYRDLMLGIMITGIKNGTRELEPRTVKKGDSWERKHEVPFVKEAVIRYRVEEVSSDAARVRFSAKMKGESPITGVSIEGYQIYDRENRLLSEIHTKLHLNLMVGDTPQKMRTEMTVKQWPQE